jgi:hypothetical protein
MLIDVSEGRHTSIFRIKCEDSSTLKMDVARLSNPPVIKYDVASQMEIIFIITTVGTSELTFKIILKKAQYVTNVKK